jgi:DNA-binding transcriptional ArsR family regulator
MSMVFRAPASFWRETAAVTGGAAAAGAAMGLAGLMGAPLVAAAGGAALVGGSLGAALTRDKPAWPWLRALLGGFGGVFAGLGFMALAWRYGLGDVGLLLAGGLGGLALSSLLAIEKEQTTGGARALGMGAAASVGAVGAVALDNVARFAISEGAPVTITAATMAGLLGLWIAAASGLRRLREQKDPLHEKADDVLRALADPMRTRVLEALATWAEIQATMEKDTSMSDEATQETERQVQLLLDALLEAARTWGQIHEDVASPKTAAVADKLTDLRSRLEATDDDVTRGHLTRALAALQAQASAIDGLKVNLGRTEAAVDAQLALLDRLRLAVAQHRVSDRERFNVELAAVSEQAARLSDDIESLSAAIAEAETLSDRRTLAELERDARRALHVELRTALDGTAPVDANRVDAPTEVEHSAHR